jgi:hypothetical protein
LSLFNQVASSLVPVLVADLDDDGARDYLEGVALAGGAVTIPLVTAPIDAGEHRLEIHTPEATEPLVLLATPVGAPTADGFPLRLRPLRPWANARRTTGAAPPVALSSRRKTSHAVSDVHAKDLASGGGPSRRRTATDLVGRAIAGGKLIIEGFVGDGGMGAVYRARHRELGMPVAVKVLHETFQHDVDFSRRFQAEALAASKLSHPNLTRVYDFGQEPDGLLYIAMEFLEGSDLRTILERDGRMPARRAVAIIAQVCAGLSHVHARGLVHNDIKPENLVVQASVDDEGEAVELVKVCDFGIALGPESERLTAGTPD